MVINVTFSIEINEFTDNQLNEMYIRNSEVKLNYYYNYCSLLLFRYYELYINYK